MQQLEAQRSAQLQQAMEAYRKEAETARLQAEQNLKTLQQEFEANLDQGKRGKAAGNLGCAEAGAGSEGAVRAEDADPGVRHRAGHAGTERPCRPA